MRIFVAGATGAIGRPLITQLLAKGHDVVALTRSSEKARTLTEQGAEAAIADVFDADAIHSAIKHTQPDVVIEQLTSLPKTYTPESMRAAAAQNDRIRLEGGANVLAAAQAVGVRRYIVQSIAFWAAPGAGLANEATPLALDASPMIANGTRTIAEIEHRLLTTANLEGIVLRYGFFYGPGTWNASDGDMAHQVRQQQFPMIGKGEGVWSWIHVEDAAIATVAAVERENPGVYLITDDQPLQVREWLPAYAQWLNAPPPPIVSVEAALEVAGADAVYYGTQLRGASNTKAKRELGFQPRLLEWIADIAIDSREIDTERAKQWLS
ncbi:MAG: NAD(P)-dependent oxidoreductase [Cyanobacteria bacterium CRU_2_1]|nr:NAD(P)-dependent oxidoreductase [Cyanobacteria bacterium CRU_2_1]